MGGKYSVSASANQNTVNVTGTFTNNGYTYSNFNETFWTECNGSRQYVSHNSIWCKFFMDTLIQCRK